MAKAKLGKEIVLKVRNEIGVLNEMCKIVSEKGVNIVAVHGVVDGEDAIVRLVTDDNLRAREALAGRNYAPRESDCVLVELPHKPGILRGITERLLAEGIDLHHLYVTAGDSRDACLVAFSSSNNDHAVVALSR